MEGHALSWPKQPGATKPFEKSFQRLTGLSKVEGLNASKEIEGRVPPIGSIHVYYYGVEPREVTGAMQGPFLTGSLWGSFQGTGGQNGFSP
jgi:hypothetical protein